MPASDEPPFGRPRCENEVRLDETGSPEHNWISMLAARLAIGLIVLICAELFSGASLSMGLWHPWTLLVTYWLYFAHFFFFTTLAIRTGRTSLASLYLWGVLFGLYESWITKVIWHGYSGDGAFVLGSVGPFGFSELSMVFIFHPTVSFLLPLAVTCVLSPPLRGYFPDLAWLTGTSTTARLTQTYLLVSCAPIMAMNSGGPLNLAINVALAVAVLFALLRWARPALSQADPVRIVAFRARGFFGLCIYLTALYAVTYRFLRADGLPAVSVQLITLGFYLLVIVGLSRHLAHGPMHELPRSAESRDMRFVKAWFATLVCLAIGLTLLRGSPVLHIPIMLNFAIWTPLGWLLTAIALVKRE